MTRSTLTLLPAGLCFLYFVGGVPFYWLHTRRAGIVREPRIEARRPSALIPKWLIYYLLWAIAPVERVLIRRRVSPNQLSSLGLLCSIGAGALIWRGWFDGGGWLYLFAGILDLLDGRVARASGRVSRAGAFYDSVADRYAECAVFAGLIVWYGASWISAVAMLALFGSQMVSYVRARAEAMGAAGPALLGAMQRPERIFLLGIALAASPFFAAGDAIVVVAIAVLAVTCHATALSRTRAVFRALHEGDAFEAPPELAATRPVNKPRVG
jgi:phosphatidylglycerophosphate synthase